MRRHNFKAAADDDSLPVMVPRNDKAAVPISLERVRRLRNSDGRSRPTRDQRTRQWSKRFRRPSH